MLSEDSLYSQTEQVLAELISVTEELVNRARGELSETALEPLQNKQEELIAKLMELDSIFKSSRKTTLEEADALRWTSIQEQLNKFQDLNNSFIDNLTVRKGMVSKEIQDIRKGQKSLGQFQSVYTAAQEKRRNRINTVQ